MYRIIYTSHQSRLFNRNSLAAISSVARRNNTRLEVSGLLVYVDRRFFQVLEGDQTVLTQLFHKIAADPRHGRFTMVDHGPIQQRAFTTWRLCCTPEDRPYQKDIPSSPISELVPTNSDLRGNDPDVRQQVRKFLSSLDELPLSATG